MLEKKKQDEWKEKANAPATKKNQDNKKQPVEGSKKKQETAPPK